jgi:tRNA(Ile)-lysidine synthase
MSRKAASAALLATRSAVVAALRDLRRDDLVVIACSGGPDSLALAAATAWATERSGVRSRAAIVDHGLHQESAQVAARAALACRDLGIADADVLTVTVGRSGGPEAAARDARYAALEALAVEHDAAAILLGHTREDQAETVLLRLARGSGARSLSGMRRRSGPWRRPFLDLSRADVRAAADEVLGPVGHEPWADPHNDDPTFARVRVRRLLGELTDAVGDGAVLGLARSADLLRDDADALDAQARDAWTTTVRADGGLVDGGQVDDGQVSADCATLAAMPRALRTRLIRRMCIEAGCRGEDLDYEHVKRVEDLVTDWHGQGEVSLPSSVFAARSCGRLCVRSR